MLRGVAVLGMLSVNVWWFRLHAANGIPTPVSDLTGASYAVWAASG